MQAFFTHCCIWTSIYLPYIGTPTHILFIRHLFIWTIVNLNTTKNKTTKLSEKLSCHSLLYCWLLCLSVVFVCGKLKRCMYVDSSLLTPWYYWLNNMISDWLISWNLYLMNQSWKDFENGASQTCMWGYFSYTLSDFFNCLNGATVWLCWSKNQEGCILGAFIRGNKVCCVMYTNSM